MSSETKKGIRAMISKNSKVSSNKQEISFNITPDEDEVKKNYNTSSDSEIDYNTLSSVYSSNNSLFFKCIS